MARSYAITTGTSDLVHARHVRLAKVPGKVELGEDCSGLYARITEGSIQLKRISVTEHPDGSLRVSFGLYVRDEPVPVPTYVPRGLDKGMNAKRLMAGGGSHKRGLNRSLAHRAFGEIRRQLSYKLPRRGGVLLLAPAWYPSTKRCSRCGHVVDAMALSERVFSCPRCHLRMDRDRNAARNLEQTAPLLLVLGALVGLGVIEKTVLHKQFYEQVSGRVASRTKNGRGGSSSASGTLASVQAPCEAPTGGHDVRRTETDPASALCQEVA